MSVAPPGTFYSRDSDQTDDSIRVSGTVSLDSRVKDPIWEEGFHVSFFFTSVSS